MEGTAFTSSSQGFMSLSTRKSMPTISKVAEDAATGYFAALILIDGTPAANVSPANKISPSSRILYVIVVVPKAEEERVREWREAKTVHDDMLVGHSVMEGLHNGCE